MSTINAQTVDPSLLNAMNSNKGAKSVAQEAQDRFMTLLVTQMKNQDPLNPLDNAQVTSQLAQLSTVTGIDKLNDSINAIGASFQSSQNLQAASMIGRGVVVPGNSLELKDGKSIFGFELPQSAERVEVLVKDANGAVVRTLDPGFMTSGFNSMGWDGKTNAGTNAVNGNYTFEVNATAGGKKMEATPFTFGLVSSVAFGSQGTILSILNMGDVPMSNVRQVF